MIGDPRKREGDGQEQETPIGGIWAIVGAAGVKRIFADAFAA